MNSESETLQQRVNQYTWYHSIDLGDGVSTKGCNFEHIWTFIEKNLDSIDFASKRVLDIGCRDCRFSLYAEKKGASSVFAFDNDLSVPARDFLLPHLHSSVVLKQMNLYDLKPETHGLFDITLMLGVLYHLRYPFNGLRAAVSSTTPGGTLVIEGGIHVGHCQDLPMLFCPWAEHNPYEPGSVSFFNALGLETAMQSFGCSLIHKDDLAGSDTNTDSPTNVRRQLFVFKRTGEMPAYLQQYWEGFHTEQSRPVLPENDDRVAWTKP